MCKLFVICQYRLKPLMPSFVTTSTKHSSDLQPGLPLKSGGSPQLWWFIFISGRCKCLRMHGGTVNHYKVGKAMVSISPSVFITGGITHTDLKLCVSAGTQGQGKWMGNTLLRLKASGHVFISCLNTLFKISLGQIRQRPEETLLQEKNILKIRYGCQHPRNCSPEPMMDKGRCAFEE